MALPQFKRAITAPILFSIFPSASRLFSLTQPGGLAGRCGEEGAITRSFGRYVGCGRVVRDPPQNPRNWWVSQDSTTPYVLSPSFPDIVLAWKRTRLLAALSEELAENQHDHLQTTAGAEFQVEMAQVGVDRMGGDPKLTGNGRLLLVIDQVLHNIEFPARQLQSGADGLPVAIGKQMSVCRSAKLHDVRLKLS